MLGDLVVNNVRIRLAKLKELLPPALPVEVASGFVQELRVSIPWTALLTAPIEVRLRTVEVQVRLLEGGCTPRTSEEGHRDPAASSAAAAIHGHGAAGPAGAAPSEAKRVASAAAASTDSSGLPEWLQSRLTAIIANVVVNVENIAVSFVCRNITLAAHVRSVELCSADPEKGWQPRFIEPQGREQVIHKVLAVRDVSVDCDVAAPASHTAAAAAGSAAASHPQLRSTPEGKARVSKVLGQVAGSASASPPEATLSDGRGPGADAAVKVQQRPRGSSLESAGDLSAAGKSASAGGAAGTSSPQLLRRDSGLDATAGSGVRSRMSSHGKGSHADDAGSDSQSRRHGVADTGRAKPTSEARVYRETPLLMRTTVVIRARIPLKPLAAAAGTEAEAGSRRQTTAATVRESGQAVLSRALGGGASVSAGPSHHAASSTASSAYLADPFAAALVLPAASQSALAQLTRPAAAAARESDAEAEEDEETDETDAVPLASREMAAALLVHVFVDWVDVSLSLRQVAMLQSVAASISTASAKASLRADAAATATAMRPVLAIADAAAAAAAVLDLSAPIGPAQELAASSDATRRASDARSSSSGEDNDDDDEDAGKDESSGSGGGGIFSWIFGSGSTTKPAAADAAVSSDERRDAPVDRAAVEGARSEGGVCRSTAKLVLVNVALAGASVVLQRHEQKHEPLHSAQSKTAVAGLSGRNADSAAGRNDAAGSSTPLQPPMGRLRQILASGGSARGGASARKAPLLVPVAGVGLVEVDASSDSESTSASRSEPSSGSLGDEYSGESDGEDEDRKSMLLPLSTPQLGMHRSISRKSDRLTAAETGSAVSDLHSTGRLEHAAAGTRLDADAASSDHGERSTMMRSQHDRKRHGAVIRTVFAPVPMLRLSVDGVRLHARVVQAGTAKQSAAPLEPAVSAGAKSSAAGPAVATAAGTSDSGDSKAAKPSGPSLQVVEVFCDVLPVSLCGWSQQKEDAATAETHMLRTQLWQHVRPARPQPVASGVVLSSARGATTAAATPAKPSAAAVAGSAPGQHYATTDASAASAIAPASPPPALHGPSASPPMSSGSASGEQAHSVALQLQAVLGWPEYPDASSRGHSEPQSPLFTAHPYATASLFPLADSFIESSTRGKTVLPAAAERVCTTVHSAQPAVRLHLMLVTCGSGSTSAVAPAGVGAVRARLPGDVQERQVLATRIAARVLLAPLQLAACPGSISMLAAVADELNVAGAQFSRPTPHADTAKLDESPAAVAASKRSIGDGSGIARPLALADVTICGSWPGLRSALAITDRQRAPGDLSAEVRVNRVHFDLRSSDSAVSDALESSMHLLVAEDSLLAACVGQVCDSGAASTASVASKLARGTKDCIRDVHADLAVTVGEAEVASWRWASLMAGMSGALTCAPLVQCSASGMSITGRIGLQLPALFFPSAGGSTAPASGATEFSRGECALRLAFARVGAEVPTDAGVLAECVKAVQARQFALASSSSIKIGEQARFTIGPSAIDLSAAFSLPADLTVPTSMAAASAPVDRSHLELVARMGDAAFVIGPAHASSEHRRRCSDAAAAEEEMSLLSCSPAVGAPPLLSFRAEGISRAAVARAVAAVAPGSRANVAGVDAASSTAASASLPSWLTIGKPRLQLQVSVPGGALHAAELLHIASSVVGGLRASSPLERSAWQKKQPASTALNAEASEASALAEWLAAAAAPALVSASRIPAVGDPTGGSRVVVSAGHWVVELSRGRGAGASAAATPPTLRLTLPSVQVVASSDALPVTTLSDAASTTSAISVRMRCQLTDGRLQLLGSPDSPVSELLHMALDVDGDSSVQLGEHARVSASETKLAVRAAPLVLRWSQAAHTALFHALADIVRPSDAAAELIAPQKALAVDLGDAADTPVVDAASAAVPRERGSAHSVAVTVQLPLLAFHLAGPAHDLLPLHGAGSHGRDHPPLLRAEVLSAAFDLRASMSEFDGRHATARAGIKAVHVYVRDAVDTPRAAEAPVFFTSHRAPLPSSEASAEAAVAGLATTDRSTWLTVAASIASGDGFASASESRASAQVDVGCLHVRLSPAVVRAAATAASYLAADEAKTPKRCTSSLQLPAQQLSKPTALSVFLHAVPLPGLPQLLSPSLLAGRQAASVLEVVCRWEGLDAQLRSALPSLTPTSAAATAERVVTIAVTPVTCELARTMAAAAVMQRLHVHCRDLVRVSVGAAGGASSDHAHSAAATAAAAATARQPLVHVGRLSATYAVQASASAGSDGSPSSCHVLLVPSVSLGQVEVNVDSSTLHEMCGVLAGFHRELRSFQDSLHRRGQSHAALSGAVPADVEAQLPAALPLAGTSRHVAYAETDSLSVLLALLQGGSSSEALPPSVASFDIVLDGSVAFAGVDVTLSAEGSSHSTPTADATSPTLGTAVGSLRLEVGAISSSLYNARAYRVHADPSHAASSYSLLSAVVVATPAELRGHTELSHVSIDFSSGRADAASATDGSTKSRLLLLSSPAASAASGLALKVVIDASREPAVRQMGELEAIIASPTRPSKHSLRSLLPATPSTVAATTASLLLPSIAARASAGDILGLKALATSLEAVLSATGLSASADAAAVSHALRSTDAGAVASLQVGSRIVTSPLVTVEPSLWVLRTERAAQLAVQLSGLGSDILLQRRGARDIAEAAFAVGVSVDGKVLSNPSLLTNILAAACLGTDAAAAPSAVAATSLARWPLEPTVSRVVLGRIAVTPPLLTVTSRVDGVSDALVVKDASVASILQWDVAAASRGAEAHGWLTSGDDVLHSAGTTAAADHALHATVVSVDAALPLNLGDSKGDGCCPTWLPHRETSLLAHAVPLHVEIDQRHVRDATALLHQLQAAAAVNVGIQRTDASRDRKKRYSAPPAAMAPVIDTASVRSIFDGAAEAPPVMPSASGALAMAGLRRNLVAALPQLSTRPPSGLIDTDAVQRAASSFDAAVDAAAVAKARASASEPMAVGEAYFTDAVVFFDGDDGDAVSGRALEEAQVALHESGWWGTVAWRTALPCYLGNVTATAPLVLAPFTFNRVAFDERTQKGAVVAHAAVSSTLQCVIEVLSAHDELKPAVHDGADGWQPVLAFELAIQSAAAAMTTPLSAVDGAAGRSEASPLLTRVRRYSHDAAGHNASALASGACWRLRWREPQLSESAPYGPTVFGDHEGAGHGRGGHSGSGSGAAVLRGNTMSAASYAALSTALLSCLHLHYGWAANAQDSSGQSLLMRTSASFTAQIQLDAVDAQLSLRSYCCNGRTERVPLARIAVAGVSVNAKGPAADAVAGTRSMLSSEAWPARSLRARLPATVFASLQHRTSLRLAVDAVDLSLLDSVSGTEFNCLAVRGASAAISRDPLVGGTPSSSGLSAVVNAGGAATMPTRPLPAATSVRISVDDVALQAGPEALVAASYVTRLAEAALASGSLERFTSGAEAGAGVGDSASAAVGTTRPPVDESLFAAAHLVLLNLTGCPLMIRQAGCPEQVLVQSSTIRPYSWWDPFQQPLAPVAAAPSSLSQGFLSMQAAVATSDSSERGPSATPRDCSAAPSAGTDQLKSSPPSARHRSGTVDTLHDPLLAHAYESGAGDAEHAGADGPAVLRWCAPVPIEELVGMQSAVAIPASTQPENFIAGTLERALQGEGGRQAIAATPCFWYIVEGRDALRAAALADLLPRSVLDAFDHCPPRKLVVVCGSHIISNWTERSVHAALRYRFAFPAGQLWSEEARSDEHTGARLSSGGTADVVAASDSSTSGKGLFGGFLAALSAFVSGSDGADAGAADEKLAAAAAASIAHSSAAAPSTGSASEMDAADSGPVVWEELRGRDDATLPPSTGASAVCVGSSPFPSSVDSVGFSLPQSQQLAAESSDGSRSDAVELQLGLDAGDGDRQSMLLDLRRADCAAGAEWSTHVGGTAGLGAFGSAGRAAVETRCFLRSSSSAETSGASMIVVRRICIPAFGVESATPSHSTLTTVTLLDAPSITSRLSSAVQVQWCWPRRDGESTPATEGDELQAAEIAPQGKLRIGRPGARLQSQEAPNPLIPALRSWHSLHSSAESSHTEAHQLAMVCVSYAASLRGAYSTAADAMALDDAREPLFAPTMLVPDRPSASSSSMSHPPVLQSADIAGMIGNMALRSPFAIANAALFPLHFAFLNAAGIVLSTVSVGPGAAVDAVIPLAALELQHEAAGSAAGAAAGESGHRLCVRAALMLDEPAASGQRPHGSGAWLLPLAHPASDAVPPRCVIVPDAARVDCLWPFSVTSDAVSIFSSESITRDSDVSSVHAPWQSRLMFSHAVVVSTKHVPHLAVAPLWTPAWPGCDESALELATGPQVVTGVAPLPVHADAVAAALGAVLPISAASKAPIRLSCMIGAELFQRGPAKSVASSSPSSAESLASPSSSSGMFLMQVQLPRLCDRALSSGSSLPLHELLPVAASATAAPSPDAGAGSATPSQQLQNDRRLGALTALHRYPCLRMRRRARLLLRSEPSSFVTEAVCLTLVHNACGGATLLVTHDDASPLLIRNMLPVPVRLQLTESLQMSPSYAAGIRAAMDVSSAELAASFIKHAEAVARWAMQLHEEQELREALATSSEAASAGAAASARSVAPEPEGMPLAPLPILSSSAAVAVPHAVVQLEEWCIRAKLELQSAADDAADADEEGSVVDRLPPPPSAPSVRHHPLLMCEPRDGASPAVKIPGNTTVPFDWLYLVSIGGRTAVLSASAPAPSRGAVSATHSATAASAGGAASEADSSLPAPAAMIPAFPALWPQDVDLVMPQPLAALTQSSGPSGGAADVPRVGSSRAASVQAVAGRSGPAAHASEAVAVDHPLAAPLWLQPTRGIDGGSEASESRAAPSPSSLQLIFWQLPLQLQGSGGDSQVSAEFRASSGVTLVELSSAAWPKRSPPAALQLSVDVHHVGAVLLSRSQLQPPQPTSNTLLLPTGEAVPWWRANREEVSRTRSDWAPCRAPLVPCASLPLAVFNLHGAKLALDSKAAHSAAGSRPSRIAGGFAGLTLDVLAVSDRGPGGSGAATDGSSTVQGVVLQRLLQWHAGTSHDALQAASGKGDDDCGALLVHLVPALHAPLTGGAAGGLHAHEAVVASHAPLRVRITDSSLNLLLRELASLPGRLALPLNRLSHSKDCLRPLSLSSLHSYEPAERAVPTIAIDRLVLPELRLEVTASLSVPVHLSVAGLSLRYNGTAARGVLCSAPILARQLVASYVADTLLQVPAVVGSLDIIGNPTGLVRRVGARVAAAFGRLDSDDDDDEYDGGSHQRVRAARGGSRSKRSGGNMLLLPATFIGQVAVGGVTLVSSVAEGLLSSVSSATLAVSRNLADLLHEGASAVESAELAATPSAARAAAAGAASALQGEASTAATPSVPSHSADTSSRAASAHGEASNIAVSAVSIAPLEWWRGDATAVSHDDDAAQPSARLWLWAPLAPTTASLRTGRAGGAEGLMLTHTGCRAYTGHGGAGSAAVDRADSRPPSRLHGAAEGDEDGDGEGVFGELGTALSSLGRGFIVAASALTAGRVGGGSSVVLAATDGGASVGAAASTTAEGATSSIEAVAASGGSAAGSSLRSNVVKAVTAPIVGGLEFVGHTSRALALAASRVGSGGYPSSGGTAAEGASAAGSKKSRRARIAGSGAASTVTALPDIWTRTDVVDRCLATLPPIAAPQPLYFASSTWRWRAAPVVLLQPPSYGPAGASAGGGSGGCACWLVLRDLQASSFIDGRTATPAAGPKPAAVYGELLLLTLDASIILAQAPRAAVAVAGADSGAASATALASAAGVLPLLEDVSPLTLAIDSAAARLRVLPSPASSSSSPGLRHHERRPASGSASGGAGAGAVTARGLPRLHSGGRPRHGAGVGAAAAVVSAASGIENPFAADLTRSAAGSAAAARPVLVVLMETAQAREVAAWLAI